MNGFVLITLRALSLLLSMQGQSKISVTLNKLIDAYEAGRDVDDYMLSVAEALKAGTEDDWDTLIARLEAEVEQLLSDAPTAVDEAGSGVALPPAAPPTEPEPDVSGGEVESADDDGAGDPPPTG